MLSGRGKMMPKNGYGVTVWVNMCQINHKCVIFGTREYLLRAVNTLWWGPPVLRKCYVFQRQPPSPSLRLSYSRGLDPTLYFVVRHVTKAWCHLWCVITSSGLTLNTCNEWPRTQNDTKWRLTAVTQYIMILPSPCRKWHGLICFAPSKNRTSSHFSFSSYSIYLNKYLFNTFRHPVVQV